MSKSKLVMNLLFYLHDLLHPQEFGSKTSSVHMILEMN